nr:hypothetical protein [uncultured Desulfuromonas sp.]
MKAQRYWIFLILMLVTLSGCSTLLHSQKNSQALQKRIQVAMEARLAGQWGVVYDSFWQTYRDKVTRDSFLSRSRVTFKSYRIGTITVAEDGKSAEAEVWASIEMRGFTFPEAQQTQIWLYEKGNWYQRVDVDGMQKAMF